MVRLVALQQRKSPPVARAPCTPRDLPHQLKRALCRPQVRSLQAQIGVDHTDQRQQREVVPLGHDLRADDDLGPPGRDGFDLFLQRPRRSEQIRGKNRHPRLGEAFGHLFGQTFHPRPHRRHPPRHPAGGAGVRHRLARPALVADEALEEAMFDHPRVAIIAANLMPAGPADGDGRIAAPVEEQKRLLPQCLPRLYRLGQRFRNPAVRGQAFVAHVNGAHLGQFGGAETGAQIQPRIFALFGIDPAFQTGRGRGQHHLCPADRRAQHSHVAGIVKNALLLLVGGIVFLIDDDQPQMLKWQEQRRPRPHHHLRRSFAQHAPQAAAFGLGDA